MTAATVPSRVIVVGGGLAGISAALRLADSGRQVLLLEARPRLGGAAFSFPRSSPAGQLTVDNGQHVFLRCCTAYRDLLARIEATDLAPLRRLDIPVLRPHGTSAQLYRTPGLPAPLHLGGALARYRLLSPGDRLRAARGALALRRLDPDDPELDHRTLAEFLRAHGQSDALVDALWGIVATATLNRPPADASLALAARVFRTGLLDRSDAADIGFSTAPLGTVHDARARRALQRAGAQVRLGVRVARVEPGAGVQVRARDGAAPEEFIAAGQVILAVPWRDALSVAPLSGTPASAAAGLGASPIVNVHVVYDRRVTDLPFAAAVDSPVQWFFDRSGASGLRAVDARHQYLAVTVSAAEAYIDVPRARLQELFLAELARLLPAARSAEVLDAFVTRERRATFCQTPGTAALRPGPDVGVPGLILAGAWTATGWPDTMEGAVRSGVAAADRALCLTEAEGDGEGEHGAGTPAVVEPGPRGTRQEAVA